MASTSPVLFWDGAELPDAVESDELPPDPIPNDDTRIINPSAGHCPECGLEIIREPGQRGRLPKYHPECKPTGKRASVSGGGNVIRVSKAKQDVADQVEVFLEDLRRKLLKATMLLSVVDPYDAFVLHVNTPDLLDNLRAILMRYDWARKAAGIASTGGSVVGFVIALATTVLPIMAHHNLIPVKRVSAFLLNIPSMMLRMQQIAASGDDTDVTETLLQKMQQRMRAQQEEEMRRRREQEAPVSASPNY